MNQFHFLRNGNKVFYISAVFSVLIGLGFLLIPRYCIYASSYIEKPETNTIVEISEEKPIEVENIDSWIKNNMEKSINFYTEHLTNDTQVSKAIINNSLKNDLPVNLAFSVAYKESKFNKEAYNDNGKSKDRGLFQLNDSYRQNWSIEDFYNVEKNAFEGTRYLKEMIELNENDIQKALYCYNAGPTKIRKYGIIPSHTVIYAQEILFLEQKLSEELKNWIINS